MRFVASVPTEFQRDGIAWLVLYRDASGWFLEKHLDPLQPSVFDTFHLLEEDARAEAEEDWGVTADLWRAAKELP